MADDDPSAVSASSSGAGNFHQLNLNLSQNQQQQPPKQQQQVQQQQQQQHQQQSFPPSSAAVPSPGTSILTSFPSSAAAAAAFSDLTSNRLHRHNSLSAVSTLGFNSQTTGGSGPNGGGGGGGGGAGPSAAPPFHEPFSPIHQHHQLTNSDQLSHSSSATPVASVNNAGAHDAASAAGSSQQPPPPPPQRSYSYNINMSSHLSHPSLSSFFSGAGPANSAQQSFTPSGAPGTPSTNGASSTTAGLGVGASGPSTAILIRHLPRGTSQNTARAMLLFATGLVSVDIVDGAPEDMGYYATAIARFVDRESAAEAQEKLHGKPNSAGDGSMVVDFVSPTSASNAAAAAGRNGSNSQQVQSQFSLDAGTTATGGGGNGVVGQTTTASTTPATTTTASGQSRFSSLFAPRSPPVPSTGGVGTNESTGKAVIDEDTDEDTGEILRDPVAYAARANQQQQQQQQQKQQQLNAPQATQQQLSHAHPQQQQQQQQPTAVQLARIPASSQPGAAAALVSQFNNLSLTANGLNGINNINGLTGIALYGRGGAPAGTASVQGQPQVQLSSLQSPVHQGQQQQQSMPPGPLAGPAGNPALYAGPGGPVYQQQQQSQMHPQAYPPPPTAHHHPQTHHQQQQHGRHGGHHAAHHHHPHHHSHHHPRHGGPAYPPANPADQNPPCNTLYVGNLPHDTSEDELKALFSKQRGYKRLCFRNKQNGPMCFVEFEDISLATKTLNELYGWQLSNSVKGGIRLSFSKNPLGVRNAVPPPASAAPPVTAAQQQQQIGLNMSVPLPMHPSRAGSLAAAAERLGPNGAAAAAVAAAALNGSNGGYPANLANGPNQGNPPPGMPQGMYSSISGPPPGLGMPGGMGQQSQPQQQQQQSSQQQPQQQQQQGYNINGINGFTGSSNNAGANSNLPSHPSRGLSLNLANLGPMSMNMTPGTAAQGNTSMSISNTPIVSPGESSHPHLGGLMSPLLSPTAVIPPSILNTNQGSLNGIAAGNTSQGAQSQSLNASSSVPGSRDASLISTPGTAPASAGVGYDTTTTTNPFTSLRNNSMMSCLASPTNSMSIPMTFPSGFSPLGPASGHAPNHHAIMNNLMSDNAGKNGSGGGVGNAGGNSTMPPPSSNETFFSFPSAPGPIGSTSLNNTTNSNQNSGNATGTSTPSGNTNVGPGTNGPSAGSISSVATHPNNLDPFFSSALLVRSLGGESLPMSTRLTGRSQPSSPGEGQQNDSGSEGRRADDAVRLTE